MEGKSILETNCVGHIYKMLVAVLVILVPRLKKVAKARNFIFGCIFGPAWPSTPTPTKIQEIK